MTAVLISLLLAITAGAARERTPQPAEPPARFVVAVVRRDGIVSPFAAFDGKDWTAPWPGNLRSTEIPIDLASVPAKWWGKSGPVERMALWVDGESRGAVRLARPTVVRPMCEGRLGVTSDYQPREPAPPPIVQPFPKDGLAVSGGQRVEAIEVVARDDPDRLKLAPLLTKPFDTAEDTAVEAFTEWKHPVRREDRRKRAIQIEALYRAPMDQPGWTAYYVEAIREYPPGPADEECGLVTSGSGWILIGPDGKSHAKVGARVTYCDRRGVIYMLPLGVFKLRDRSYWAYQLSGYGQEGYAIARPQPKVVMQEVFYSAGECL
jgi:hypothetical protein